MTSKDFVEAFYKEKQYLLKEYLSPDSETEVSTMIKSLGLNKEQSDILEKLLESSFTDIFYTILLGLEGESSIGGKQESYKIFDEDNNELTGGEIEAYAWEYFHNK